MNQRSYDFHRSVLDLNLQSDVLHQDCVKILADAERAIKLAGFWIELARRLQAQMEKPEDEVERLRKRVAELEMMLREANHAASS